MIFRQNEKNVWRYCQYASNATNPIKIGQLVKALDRGQTDRQTDNQHNQQRITSNNV